MDCTETNTDAGIGVCTCREVVPKLEYPITTVCAKHGCKSFSRVVVKPLVVRLTRLPNPSYFETFAPAVTVFSSRLARSQV